MKITFMGAGSTVFARNVLGDCMCTPALCEAEIALYDINEERLKDSEIILGAINKNVNESRATIKTYLFCFHFIVDMLHVLQNRSRDSLRHVFPGCG